MTFASTGCRPLDAIALERDSSLTRMRSFQYDIISSPLCGSLRASRPAKQTPWDDNQNEALRIVMVPYISTAESSRGISIPVASRRTCTSGNGWGPCKKKLSIFASLVYYCCARFAHGPNILPQRPGIVLNF